MRRKRAAERTVDARTESLLHALDRAYDTTSWHGPNLRGAIRGVTHEQAARRPGEGRNSLWELVVHCAYWKYTVRRRLRGEKRGRGIPRRFRFAIGQQDDRRH